MAVDWNNYYEPDGNMAVRLNLPYAVKTQPPLTIFAWVHPHGTALLGPGGTIMSINRDGIFARFDQLMLQLEGISGTMLRAVATRTGGVVSHNFIVSDPFDYSTNGGWHSICAVYDQAYSAIYIDGVQSGQISTFSTWPDLESGDNTNTTLGATAFLVGPQWTTGFSGCMAVPTVFNWLLSPDEVAYLHSTFNIDGLCTLAGKVPNTDILYLARLDDFETATTLTYGTGSLIPSPAFTAGAATCTTAPDLNEPALPPETESHFTFASLHDTQLHDWRSVDPNTTGADFNSFLYTYYHMQDDTMFWMYSPYVLTYLENSSRNSSSPACIFQPVWEWSDVAGTNKFGPEIEIYRSRPSQTVSDVKNKVRGKGRALQMRYFSEEGKDFNLLGWGMELRKNTKP